MELMPINPSVLEWARRRAGYRLDDLNQDFRKIADWESGLSGPTYPQLEKLAGKLRVPVAVFFFPKPPDLPEIEKSFRTLGAAEFGLLPPQIRLLLRKAGAFQISLEELNEGRNPAPRLITRDLQVRPAHNLPSIAARVRNYLGVPIETQLNWPDSETALEKWRTAFAESGVYVFKDQFRCPEYSGFSLYADEFPIIYVNNTRAKTHQIFTLFHELAHLLFHTSGVDASNDDFVEMLPADDRQIEIICNRLAAQLLIPEDAFRNELSGLPATEETATRLAERFGVSREAIYRKFLDRKLISADEYRNAADRWAAQTGSGGGGNYYSTKVTYLGLNYITLAFQRYYQNRIGMEELAEHLNIKPKNLARLEERISARIA